VNNFASYWEGCTITTMSSWDKLENVITHIAHEGKTPRGITRDILKNKAPRGNFTDNLNKTTPHGDNRDSQQQDTTWEHYIDSQQYDSTWKHNRDSQQPLRQYFHWHNVPKPSCNMIALQFLYHWMAYCQDKCLDNMPFNDTSIHISISSPASIWAIFPWSVCVQGD